MDKIHQLLAWLNQMVSEPYYLFHFLAFFSYFVVRTSATAILSPHITDRLLHREIQAIVAFSMLTVFKMVKQESWEAFIADTLLFAKVFLIGITLIMDYYLALWYIMVFLVIYILTQQPAYQGLGASNKLTPLQLEALLTEGNTSRFWLVEFRALCSSTCISISRFFPELSITYSNKNLSFGIVDLGLFPNAAEKFGISLEVEVAHLPEVEIEAKASHPTITKGTNQQSDSSHPATEVIPKDEVKQKKKMRQQKKECAKEGKTDEAGTDNKSDVLPGSSEQVQKLTEEKF